MHSKNKKNNKIEKINAWSMHHFFENIISLALKQYESVARNSKLKLGIKINNLCFLRKTIAIKE